LVDNRAAGFGRNGYTFFIYVDSSIKQTRITDDLKTVFKKSVLSHEACHFVYYYELFERIGGDSTSTAYTKFQSMVSGQLKNAITNEADVTNQTVTEEHFYTEFITNFWLYDNNHFDKKKKTNHDYKSTNKQFFNWLTLKLTNN